MTASQTEQLRRLLKISKSTVFFGGAGVSTESGIPDFRSATGLYHARQVFGKEPEYLLSHSCFANEPELFFRYYRKNLIARNAKPNAAHLALARLEAAGKLQAVVTQNIDGLHQAAGSKNVLELHGSNWRQSCVDCGAKYALDYIMAQDGIPKCEKCGGIVRPDVVLYEEGLDNGIITAAVEAIAAAELLIVGGTSLAVYPAAGLLRYFSGGALVLINKTATPYDAQADLVIHDSIGKVLGEAVQENEACRGIEGG
ncbi:MAG: NAD-dependent protein deacylase [Oscillospiraceae bacterium]|jgi:NAD-dependent deacetylase|nr:NAD-dependent protein deacylase [Oscillospiraceae bacterium]